MSAPKLKIKKGDQVIVITGKDKGNKGEVLKVFPDTARVLVQGINMATKHKKPGQGTPGGVEKQEKSLHISNVALTDPKNGKATRVGYKVLKDDKKVRVARRSGETIG